MTEARLGTALITGASSGIGAVYADRLARRGYDLILVARNVEAMSRLAERLGQETGRNIRVEPADLSVFSEVSRIGYLIAAEPDLSLVVNNAGITLPAGQTLTSADEAAVSQLIALNVTATALLSRAAARALKARGAGGIINVSSVLALLPEMFDGTYSASKAFILNLCQGLSKELSENGVYVQAVLPGMVRTEIWSRAGHDISAFPTTMIMDVDDLVDAALAGFDQREAVTIPSLENEGLWVAMQQARGAMGPHLSSNKAASRYHVQAEA